PSIELQLLNFPFLFTPNCRCSNFVFNSKSISWLISPYLHSSTTSSSPSSSSPSPFFLSKFTFQIHIYPFQPTIIIARYPSTTTSNTTNTTNTANTSSTCCRYEYEYYYYYYTYRELKIEMNK